MNKKTIFLILGLILIIGLFFIGKKTVFSPVATTTPAAVSGGETENPETTSGVSQINLEIPEQILPLSNDPKDVAWALFQKYLLFNKNHNVEGIKSVVYKISPVCSDPNQKIDCEARMSSAYSYGSTLKKDDFTNVWSDEKQTILSTDFKDNEDEKEMSRTRAIIFFVRDNSGDLKLLSFSPNKGAVVSKDTSASREELEERIIIYTEDNDNDGISDYQERCLGIKEGETCAKTNTNLRDTDGNGYWDGTQALMNQ